MNRLEKENTTPDISICIATFRRPQGLTRLLDSLQRLSGTKDFTLEIIVIDNDAAETARPVVEELKSRYTCLRYGVEPRQNISHARNRAVEQARGTWIAFIDDDEVAGENWLAEYWQMIRKIPGDGYFGPVLPRLEKAGPSWLDPEVFFSRPRYPSGTRLKFYQTRTGNAFIRRSLFNRHKFDPFYGLTGGGDTELFSRMMESGAKFFWCDTAQVFEYIPSHRLTFKWLLQRAFRKGVAYTYLQRRRSPRYSRQMIELLKALAGIFVFASILPLEVFRGRTAILKGLLRLCVQVGHLWAFLNLTYEEYKVEGMIPGN
ncbi:MAG TPA: glycosyltransferase [Candidatus Limnocylindrales bacterium]|nr:glycosyltransferase [Candidatus Limnocylindrales bacterium]